MLVAVPWALLPYLDVGLTFLLAALFALPFLLQGPAALMAGKPRAAVLTFLNSLGAETEIAASKPFTLSSFMIKVRAPSEGKVHEFWIGYVPFHLRRRPHIKMVWPTERQGISLQNRHRFNLFSSRFNTIEYTYLKNWHLQLFAYPMKGDFWWFNLYLFGGVNATEHHLKECFQIGLETKDKLTRANPAF